MVFQVVQLLLPMAAGGLRFKHRIPVLESLTVSTPLPSLCPQRQQRLDSKRQGGLGTVGPLGHSVPQSCWRGDEQLQPAGARHRTHVSSVTAGAVGSVHAALAVTTALGVFL